MPFSISKGKGSTNVLTSSTKSKGDTYEGHSTNQCSAPTTTDSELKYNHKMLDSTHQDKVPGHIWRLRSGCRSNHTTWSSCVLLGHRSPSRGSRQTTLLSPSLWEAKQEGNHPSSQFLPLLYNKMSFQNVIPAFSLSPRTHSGAPRDRPQG